MSVARTIYDERVFVPVALVRVRKSQEVFVVIVDEPRDEYTDKPFLRLAGALSDEDYAEIEEALKDTEITDYTVWQGDLWEGKTVDKIFCLVQERQERRMNG
ncbi:MAG: hypothetical protein LBK67_02415 [Coriobacteriales bacterium]|nr:hypothetical protein [Coriobacteriales bacterium]